MSSATDRQIDLAHLDAALVDALQRSRAEGASERLLPGLCITDDEINRLMARMPWASYHGLSSRLERLHRQLGLTTLDLRVLLVCLAPDLDARYERVYAYLQDDATARRPGLDLILRLVADTPDAQLRARHCLAASGLLRQWQLLRPIDQHSGAVAPTCGLRVDEPIVDFLTGIDSVDPRLAGIARTAMPRVSLDDLVLASDLSIRLRRLSVRFPNDETLPVLHFLGRRGSGRQSAAEALCIARKCELLVARPDELVTLGAADIRTMTRALVRDALLHERALWVGDLDPWFLPERQSSLQALIDELLEFPGLLLLASEGPWTGVWETDRPLLRLEFAPLGFGERVRAWRSALDESEMSDEGVVQIANEFRLPAGRIRAAAAQARVEGRLLGARPCSVDDVRRACRTESTHGLSRFGHRMACRRSWRDLVLPANRLQQLHEVCRAVRYRSRVYDTWGFDTKLSLGKGLAILFTGPPGTGKTLAAEVLGTELGLDLYRVDLSAVVSKYIGETEKHLARIFADAEASNAVLFFDEADALFGQRTEVKDAHDRYANVEISYLLTRLEQHEGIVMLASNLRKNVDEAFVRRMHFIVDFPMPALAERFALWETIWPERAPRADDLDVRFLAAQFELSGGHIRNAALAAAFLAAEQGSAITMAHVMAAVRREYQKMGTLVMDQSRWSHPAVAAATGERVQDVS